MKERINFFLDKKTRPFFIMSSVALIFDVIFSCLITLIFLYRCGNYRRQHPITTGAVFIAWSFSILFVFLLPLDISLVNIHFVLQNSFGILFIKAAYRECERNQSSSTTTIISTITDENLNQVKQISFLLNINEKSFVECFSPKSMSSTMVLCQSEIL
jgi:hypothetical protein